MSQIREQVHFTKGRIIVRGKAKFADYILYYKPNPRSPSFSSTAGTARSVNKRSTTSRRPKACCWRRSRRRSGRISIRST